MKQQRGVLIAQTPRSTLSIAHFKCRESSGVILAPAVGEDLDLGSNLREGRGRVNPSQSARSGSSPSPNGFRFALIHFTSSKPDMRLNPGKWEVIARVPNKTVKSLDCVLSAVSPASASQWPEDRHQQRHTECWDSSRDEQLPRAKTERK
jgi:hypothetical protein